MRISSYDVALSSAHQLRQTSSQKESFRFWSGQRPPVANANSPGSQPPSPTPPRRNVADAPPCRGKDGIKETDDAESDSQLDAPTRTLKLLIEKMFGGKIRVASFAHPAPAESAGSLPPQPPAADPAATPARVGWGMEYRADQITQELEQLQFAASGLIKTADGQEISFNLSLQIQRASVQESHIDIRAGDAAIDPLVLNFDGSAAELASGTFQFDLQADGQYKNLPLLGRASAFLALDRNRDGVVNNGRELFGPATGQGFAELAQYDSDENGWIDENDPVYADLRLWQPASDGNGNLATLAEKNVGAIYLESAATPFTYKDAAGQALAASSATSIFLQENGAAGTIQELNYFA